MHHGGRPPDALHAFRSALEGFAGDIQRCGAALWWTADWALRRTLATLAQSHSDVRAKFGHSANSVCRLGRHDVVYTEVGVVPFPKVRPSWVTLVGMGSMPTSRLLLIAQSTTRPYEQPICRLGRIDAPGVWPLTCGPLEGVGTPGSSNRHSWCVDLDTVLPGCKNAVIAAADDATDFACASTVDVLGSLMCRPNNSCTVNWCWVHRCWDTAVVQQPSSSRARMCRCWPPWQDQVEWYKYNNSAYTKKTWRYLGAYLNNNSRGFSCVESYWVHKPSSAARDGNHCRVDETTKVARGYEGESPVVGFSLLSRNPAPKQTNLPHLHTHKQNHKLRRGADVFCPIWLSIFL